MKVKIKDTRLFFSSTGILDTLSQKVSKYPTTGMMKSLRNKAHLTWGLELPYYTSQDLIT